MYISLLFLFSVLFWVVSCISQGHSASRWRFRIRAREPGAGGPVVRCKICEEGIFERFETRGSREADYE